MPQKLYPSAHILEMFMPYLHDEKRLIEVLRKIAEMGFYRNVELPTFPTKEHRDTVRRILRDNDLTAATYAAPYLNERGMSLCDLNDRRRAETIRYLKMQADLAAECGYSTFGVPSGPYPGDEFHDEAMAVQADTLARIADYTALLGMNCSIEPLDRYVHKKALIGPMDEVVRWFKPMHKAHPNLFLHWDSSHEQLGGLGIFNTDSQHIFTRPVNNQAAAQIQRKRGIAIRMIAKLLPVKINLRPLIDTIKYHRDPFPLQ